MDIENTIRQALNDCVGEIRRRSTAAGQVATGKTLRALEVRMKREGDAIIGEIWGKPYTGVLETGSRPARNASRSPKLTQAIMKTNLAEWMRVRGLANGLTDKQLQNAAAHLAWYIRRYGTKLHRQGGRRDIITPAIEATKQTVEQQLSLYYEQLITEQIDNNFFNSK